MRTNEALNAPEAANVIPLTIHPKPARKERKERFRVIEYDNRGGSKSWRVTGIKRGGTRVRENYADVNEADARKSELMNEWLEVESDVALRKTSLTDEQLRLCEAGTLQLGEDWRKVIDAITYWQQHGKQRAALESPRLDDALEQYLEWLKASPFRDATKRHWRIRMTNFRDGMENIRVADIMGETIHNYLNKRNVSEVGRDTDRRAISRFFSWCIEPPRKWVATNPCRNLPRAQKGEAKPIEVLTLNQSRALLKAAPREGLAPYLAVCLFGGLRPFEAQRLTWQSVNLKDREIRLEPHQVKTGRKSGRGRTIAICDTLHAWLKKYEGKSFYPSNWRKKFDRVKRAAGFGTPDEKKKHLKPWPADICRHTAISNYFRKTGSYGQTAEQFGNSECIIKSHYQGRVSSEDTKKFYQLRPTKRRTAK